MLLSVHVERVSVSCMRELLSSNPKMCQTKGPTLVHIVLQFISAPQLPTQPGLESYVRELLKIQQTNNSFCT